MDWFLVRHGDHRLMSMSMAHSSNYQTAALDDNNERERLMRPKLAQDRHLQFR